MKNARKHMSADMTAKKPVTDLTREEAAEIEFSSLFYTEDGAIFMTASVLTAPTCCVEGHP